MQELTVKVPAEKTGEYRIEIGTDIPGSVWSKIESQFGSAGFDTSTKLSADKLTAGGKFIITDAKVVKAGISREVRKTADKDKYAKFYEEIRDIVG
jgi:hypothetical protein